MRKKDQENRGPIRFSLTAGRARLMYAGREVFSMEMDCLINDPAQLLKQIAEALAAAMNQPKAQVSVARKTLLREVPDQVAPGDIGKLFTQDGMPIEKALFYARASAAVTGAKRDADGILDYSIAQPEVAVDDLDMVPGTADGRFLFVDVDGVAHTEDELVIAHACNLDSRWSHEQPETRA